MGYCTRQDLEERLGADVLAALADVNQDGAEDLAAVDRAIGDIDAQIDGALRVRWPEAVGVASPLLLSIAVDLVAYQLATGLARTTERAERAEAAAKRLGDIQAGRVSPAPVVAGDLADAGGIGQVQMGRIGRSLFGGGF